MVVPPLSSLGVLHLLSNLQWEPAVLCNLVAKEKNPG